MNHINKALENFERMSVLAFYPSQLPAGSGKRFSHMQILTLAMRTKVAAKQG